MRRFINPGDSSSGGPPHEDPVGPLRKVYQTQQFEILSFSIAMGFTFMILIGLLYAIGNDIYGATTFESLSGLEKLLLSFGLGSVGGGLVAFLYNFLLERRLRQFGLEVDLY